MISAVEKRALNTELEVTRAKVGMGGFITKPRMEGWSCRLYQQEHLAWVRSGQLGPHGGRDATSQFIRDVHAQPGSRAIIPSSVDSRKLSPVLWRHLSTLTGSRHGRPLLLHCICLISWKFSDFQKEIPICKAHTRKGGQLTLVLPCSRVSTELWPLCPAVCLVALWLEMFCVVLF